MGESPCGIVVMSVYFRAEASNIFQAYITTRISGVSRKAPIFREGSEMIDCEAERESSKLSTVSVVMNESPAQRNQPYEDCDVQLHTKYLNYTGRPLWVGSRDGMVFELPPRTHRQRSQLVVRKDLHLSSYAANKARDFLVSYDGMPSKDFQIFKELFLSQYEKQDHGLWLCYDHELPFTKIRESEGGVYVAELDIILSDRQNDVPLHPFCYESMVSQPLIGNVRRQSGMTAYIVDNGGRIGRRYLRIKDRVIRVESTRNSLKASGLYIEYTGVVAGERDNASSAVEFYPEEQLDAIKWIFFTYPEAKYSAEYDAELNLELKEKDVEVRRMDAEGRRNAATTAVHRSAIDLEKMEYEQEKLRLEKNNMLLQSQLDEENRKTKRVEEELKRQQALEEHHSKLTQLKSKDFYEERAAVRKDSSEWVKFIPALLGVAGAAFFGFKSLFSK